MGTLKGGKAGGGKQNERKSPSSPSPAVRQMLSSSIIKSREPYAGKKKKYVQKLSVQSLLFFYVVKK